MQNNTLRDQTLAYWKVSRAWNGKSEIAISTVRAITNLNGVLNSCTPKAAVVKRSGVLLNAIIIGKKTSKAKKKASA